MSRADRTNASDGTDGIDARARVPALTGASLDRASALRADPERLAALLADPTAALVAASGDAVALTAGPGAPRNPTLLRRRLDGDGPTSIDPAQAILLGLEHGSPLFAVDLDALGDDDARRNLVDGGEMVPLRDAGVRLPRSESGLAAYLVALLNWHRRHRFCANCGAMTTLAEAGLSRHCPRCGASHFPRTDPVVIMLVEHDGRLLLGRRPGWPANRYSVLAGFVAPGETPEEAVVREVAEESGIAAHRPRYVASQPWPFPASLMLGYEADSGGGEPLARDGELEAVGWFTLDEIRAAAAGRGELRLPPAISIARVLIDGWLDRQAATPAPTSGDDSREA